jgi:hypothetical protein
MKTINKTRNLLYCICGSEVLRCEENYLLRCDNVWTSTLMTFRRNVWLHLKGKMWAKQQDLSTWVISYQIYGVMSIIWMNVHYSTNEAAIRINPSTRLVAYNRCLITYHICFRIITSPWFIPHSFSVLHVIEWCVETDVSCQHPRTTRRNSRM